MVLNNSFEEYKTDLDVRLRRIETNVPEITSRPINTFALSVGSCYKEDQVGLKEGPAKFLVYLLKAPINCSLAVVNELVDFITLPFRSLLWDLIPWLTQFVANIVSNLVGDLVAEHGNLNAYSGLITMINDSFFKYPFNPNYTKSFPSSYLVPPALMENLPVSLEIYVA